MPNARLSRSSARPLAAHCALLLGAWLFAPARSGRAETALSYKYVDYREAGGRVGVQSHYALIEQDLGPDFHAKLNGVIDAIAGATPTGQPPATPGGQVPLTNVHDRRKAWGLELARQFPRLALSAGFANSRESDYVSDGWSLNALADCNEKNTTLLLGGAGTSDDVKVFYQQPWAHKRTFDLIAGVTQLLDAQTVLTFNLGHGRATGYLADPYRVVLQRTEVEPGIFLPLTYGENRPGARDKWTALLACNRFFAPANGAVEASYRFYRDTFGTTAHTVELAWFQKLGERFTLRPELRYYDQTAADFYRIDVTGADFVPTGRPNPAGPFFSADYRLSAFRSYNYGLKAIWDVTANCRLDLTVERYEMRGKDGVTSATVYPRAVTLTAGARLAW